MTSWGPYEIRPELYRSAMKRLQLLRSGRIDAQDKRARPKTGSKSDPAALYCGELLKGDARRMTKLTQ